MAAVAGLPARTNGLTSVPNESAEYEKILKLRDEIFAGLHPRLKVSAHGVSSRAAPGSVLPPSTLPTTKLSESKVPGLNLGKTAGDVASSQPALNGLPLKAVSPTKSLVPGLNPIFLTKSDELVRAEIQLQRQRLEKQLREQAENKRIESRTQPAIAEAKPDFDVTDVLEVALETVKPITLSEIQEAIANASASDSFDENSLYSSRAPDSTPEDRHDRSTRNRYRKAREQAMDLDDEGEIREQDISDDIQQAGRPGAKRRDSRAFANVYQQPQDPSDRYSPPDVHIGSDEDMDGEEEYSPPEAVEPALYTDPSGQKSSHRRRSSGRGYEQYQRRDSPAADFRTVRNNITSPLAPQPQRLSSLAEAKQITISQNRRVSGRQIAGMESQRTSPEMQPVPRKRRKVQEGGRKGRRRGQSPAVKNEPVSPPPFHDVPPLGNGTTPRSDRPVLIDVDTPTETRYVPVDRAPVYQTQPISYGLESPTGQTGQARAVSVHRPVYREVVRDNQDLRRVASMQHMQAGHPTETVRSAPFAEQPLARAPSYTVLDRQPVRATSVMYDAAPPTNSRQYIQEQPAPTSPVYRDQFAIERPTSRATVMAAPPPPQLQPPPQMQRRIIVDEAGNRYYENVPPPREMSMAPPRQLMRDPYETGPAQYARASTVFEAPQQRETRYIPNMPPPPPLSNRVSVAPRAEVYEQPMYAQYDGAMQAPSQRSGSVQVVDYHSRQQPTYVDERHAPRDEYVRMSSVRPAEPYGQERAMRMTSVRPMERAVSVFGEMPGQYMVQQQQPQYAVAQPIQGGQYYQGANGSQVGHDGARDVRYSVVPQQRY